MFITLMFCFMLLIKFLFHVQIIELEKRSLTKIENELKSMKEEARKKEVMTKEEQAKRLKETTKDMVGKWWPGLLQGCSSEDVILVCLITYTFCFYRKYICFVV